ncbi:MAG: bile acid:sodium symporter [Lentisphaeria bacterium]|nr:bile acid:sodium symporter [Lentisphaeria bacterium]
MLKFITKQWFMLGLITVVIVGSLYPQVASWNEGGRLTTSFVALIFLGMGITLPSEAVVNGLSKWKIHLFIQAFIFVITPIYFALTIGLIKGQISREILIGLLALSVLPTTISTCTVFTQISGGNSIITLFNASLSNILGIFISPLLLSVLLREAGQVMPMSVLVKIITGLGFTMVLPLIIGQVFRYFNRQKAIAAKKKIGSFSNFLILLIVFFTMAGSASNPSIKQDFSGYAIPIIYLIITHFILLVFVFIALKISHLSGPEKISIVYTAPQKTLAMGVPLLSAYFAKQPEILGIAILPLLFYHPWQLIIAGIIKPMPFMKKWRAEGEEE